jgi:DNA polymerase-3 subunit gamma/tau
MFENLIAQPASDLLIADIAARRLPPAMLFSGPDASGKLTAALELARVLSCAEGTARWTCACGACARSKELTHQDLLIMGPRNSTLEIRAAAAAFLREKTVATRFLFIRSIRKLAIRFSPALAAEDDTRAQKAAPLLAEMEELLEEISPSRELPEGPALEKTVGSLVEDAEKLETDFMYDSIPVSQVRSASSWARLSPAGKKKVLIVENADRMQDSARNAFLKVLEEPPEDVVFILTTSRRGAIMPTILSRVRTYAFVDRPEAAQNEVIVRVFHDTPEAKESLEAYFYRFLPVPMATIAEVADAFLSMTLIGAIDEGRRPLAALKTVLARDGAHSAGAGQGESALTIAQMTAKLNKCKPAIVWQLFLACISRRMRAALRVEAIDARETAVYSGWTDAIRSALEAVDVYNIGPQAALEALNARMRESL